MNFIEATLIIVLTVNRMVNFRCGVNRLDRVEVEG